MHCGSGRMGRLRSVLYVCVLVVLRLGCSWCGGCAAVPSSLLPLVVWSPLAASGRSHTGEKGATGHPADHRRVPPRRADGARWMALPSLTTPPRPGYNRIPATRVLLIRSLPSVALAPLALLSAAAASAAKCCILVRPAHAAHISYLFDGCVAVLVVYHSCAILTPAETRLLPLLHCLPRAGHGERKESPHQSTPLRPSVLKHTHMPRCRTAVAHYYSCGDGRSGRRQRPAPPRRRVGDCLAARRRGSHHGHATPTRLR